MPTKRHRPQPFRRLIALAVVVVGGAVSSPATAHRWHHYDHSYYRAVHGHARDLFIDPVGKLDNTVLRRLPKLDVAPARLQDLPRQTTLSRSPPTDDAPIRKPTRGKSRPASPSTPPPKSP
jgi:hypothetical protein